MRVFLFVILIGILPACKLKKQSMDKTEATPATTMQNHPEVVTITDYQRPSNPALLSIVGAKIEGDLLHIDVSYSGGCTEHSFRLIFSGNYKKSMPPQASVYLEHDAKDDSCRSLVEKSLIFNVRKMRFPPEKPGTLILSIEGWNEQLKYVY